MHKLSHWHSTRRCSLFRTETVPHGVSGRTPVCNQGYYVDNQERYVRGTRYVDEVQNFERFLEPRLAGQRLDWEYSNPNFTMNWEMFVNKTTRIAEVRQHGNERYLEAPTGFQGGYYCSIRSVTEWERPGVPHGTNYIFDHPNYYSRYMNTHIQDDYQYYTHWTGMEWSRRGLPWRDFRQWSAPSSWQKYWNVSRTSWKTGIGVCLDCCAEMDPIWNIMSELFWYRQSLFITNHFWYNICFVMEGFVLFFYY